jgi:hypothetical protein
MNLTNPLQPVDLTTPTRVKSLRGADAVADTSDDTLIAQLISSVSARFCRETNLHGLIASRTEVYKINRFAKRLTIDAKPVTAISEIKYSSHTDFTDVAAQATTDYVLDVVNGTVMLDFETNYAPGYVQVMYTGGWGTDAANAISNEPELAEKCDMQVGYTLSRRRALGGSVNSGAGQNATYTGEFGLLREVRDHLHAIARGGGF